MNDNSATNDGTVTDSDGRPVSPTVIEALQTAELRIRSATVAFRVWDRLFTDEDRQHLGGDIEPVWVQSGTIGLWQRARGGSVEQAIIDVANGVNLLDDRTAEWLRRELGIPAPSEEVARDRPTWDPQRGELRWGDDVIRPVRVLREPTNIQTILDAFQAAGWPSRIDNPLTLGQEQLHQTLRSLNRGLSTIRFHGQEGAGAITWQRV